MHCWPDNWGLTSDGTDGGTLKPGAAYAIGTSSSTSEDGAAFTASFIESHARVAQESLGKPILVEEHGKEAPTDAGSEGDFAERERYLSAAFGAIERSGAAGSLLWHLCAPGVTFGVPAYCVWPEEEGPHAGSWALVKKHAAAMKQLAASASAASLC